MHQTEIRTYAENINSDPQSSRRAAADALRSYEKWCRLLDPHDCKRLILLMQGKDVTGAGNAVRELDECLKSVLSYLDTLLDCADKLVDDPWSWGCQIEEGSRRVIWRVLRSPRYYHLTDLERAIAAVEAATNHTYLSQHAKNVLRPEHLPPFGSPGEVDDTSDELEAYARDTYGTTCN